MSAVARRLVPRKWRALPERSARLRLTLLYSGMFLLLGTALILIPALRRRTSQPRL